jgi:outer membrane protein assembly factor BamD
MVRRLLVIAVVVALTFGVAGCHHNKVQNPIANVDSKQPDKVLFDRAMEAMRDHKYDVARMSLQTLINTYPDSEYIARAKLAIGDSWYAEGGSSGLSQAENEYKDFITFFPNMPEAAEAQMKVANIHYQQMEKADRDDTHAIRAEEEYRQMILQYPDSKLVPEAKQKLRDVQEVLAEREFEIGRFYYMREAYPAAIARLESVVDTYPLFSGADEALFALGDIYEREIARTRANPKINEDVKGRMIHDFTAKAQVAYDRILTRYPISPRAADAKRRLEALKLPVPTATPEAIAENKKEQESRHHNSMMENARLNLHRHPDMSMAAHVGDPPLTDPQQTNAVEIERHVSDLVLGKNGSESKQVSVETLNNGAPPASDAVPRSDNGAPTSDPNNSTGIPELTPAPASSTTSPSAAPATTANPSTASTAPAPAPAQVNDAANASSQSGGDGQSTAASGGQSGSAAQSNSASAANSSSSSGSSQDDSSSKKKEKKGLLKIWPF